MNFIKCCAVIVVVLGVASLVMGIVFIAQGGSGKQKVADQIAPLTLEELDDKYETVKMNAAGLAQKEEPGIQAGTAAPSAMYNYLSLQRTSLGLARSNVGTADYILTHGIIDIVIGLGLVLGGVGIFKQSSV